MLPWVDGWMGERLLTLFAKQEHGVCVLWWKDEGAKVGRSHACLMEQRRGKEAIVVTKINIVGVYLRISQLLR